MKHEMKWKCTVVLCTVCCVAAGAWAGGGILSAVGVQDVTSLLPLPKFDVAALFEAADVNHDQRVTFQEAHNYNFLVTQAQFDTYDTDHNGYIDRAEAGLPPVEFDITAACESADANNDGQVTFDEMYAYNPLVTRAQFDTYDANGDGVIERAEAGLPPVDPGKGGCAGCTSGKFWPAGGDLFAMALSLLGLAAMAKLGRTQGPPSR